MLCSIFGSPRRAGTAYFQGLHQRCCEEPRLCALRLHHSRTVKNHPRELSAPSDRSHSRDAPAVTI